MTYVLREQTQNRYYHQHGKIIEFDTLNEAQFFANQFAQFANGMAVMGMMQGQGEYNIMEIQQVCQSTIAETKPEHCECDFINYKNLGRECQV